MTRQKRIAIRAVPLAAFVALTLAPLPVLAESPLAQWKAGLSGALLTAYSGSVISSNSSLTTLRLCRNGRFQLDREGSWNAGGAAMGANQSRITGRWDVIESGGQIIVTYTTDAGDQGGYPVWLRNDGKVDLGGVAYAAQRGGAGC
ncbi:MAG: hypothetical protein NXI30_16090 [bacterium]|nr:hypothetical protein [bacterium]